MLILFISKWERTGIEPGFLCSAARALALGSPGFGAMKHSTTEPPSSRDILLQIHGV